MLCIEKGHICREMPKFPYPLFSSGWQWTVHVLNKHTDMISSAGILAITTCLLAAKIFKNIPPFLPRLARIVFNFGGIIWLNVQMRDLIKSGRDLYRASDWQGVLETAAKVFYKSVNVFLTCAIFGASVAAVCGFPYAPLALSIALRPISLASLGINIATDIRDYFVNESILHELKQIEDGNALSLKKTMICFLEIITRSKQRSSFPKEKKLADLLVRQIDVSVIETFQEQLKSQNPFKLFHSVKDSMVSKQAGTKANLSLIALGYISMGICRAFPDSLIEMTTRWGMSVLYTDELIRQKLFQCDLKDEG